MVVIVFTKLWSFLRWFGRRVSPSCFGLFRVLFRDSPAVFRLRFVFRVVFRVSDRVSCFAVFRVSLVFLSNVFRVSVSNEALTHGIVKRSVSRIGAF